jgi:hypothetical protein
MDDRTLIRKSVCGWVNSYMAVDVLSGYWFRPAYIVGRPTAETVYDAFRNMFCELDELGLPSPGELEVEHFLMKNFAWLNDVFLFVRFCAGPTEKRAEHAINSLKYGVSKREGHTRGRWYAKHEAWRSVHNKVDVYFVEPEYQPQTIVADDLADIEMHNNELHPYGNHSFGGHTAFCFFNTKKIQNTIMEIIAQNNQSLFDIAMMVAGSAEAAFDIDALRDEVNLTLHCRNQHQHAWHIYNSVAGHKR